MAKNKTNNFKGKQKAKTTTGESAVDNISTNNTSSNTSKSSNVKTTSTK